MARNAVRKVQQAAVAAEPAQEAPPMKGGTLGVPSKLQAVPTGMASGATRTRDGAPGGRQYKVMSGPMSGGQIMVSYPGNGKTRLMVGKIVSDVSCDIEHLRRQGVELKDVTPELPPEPERPAATDEPDGTDPEGDDEDAPEED